MMLPEKEQPILPHLDRPELERRQFGHGFAGLVYFPVLVRRDESQANLFYVFWPMNDFLDFHDSYSIIDLVGVFRRMDRFHVLRFQDDNTPQNDNIGLHDSVGQWNLPRS